MNALITKISEDTGYKPSSGSKPEKRFFIETDLYRWEVLVSRFLIVESGTPVYKAFAEEEGHSAYGLTANEAVNDVAQIMRTVLAVKQVKKIAFENVRYYLDPISAAREEIRISEEYSKKPLLSRLFGFVGN